MFVKNEDGDTARNVTLHVGGRKFPPFNLKVNESYDIPVNVTEGLIVDSLTYEDIHGNKIPEKSNIVPATIIVDFNML